MIKPEGFSEQYEAIQHAIPEKNTLITCNCLILYNRPLIDIQLECTFECSVSPSDIFLYTAQRFAR